MFFVYLDGDPCKQPAGEFSDQSEAFNYVRQLQKEGHPEAFYVDDSLRIENEYDLQDRYLFGDWE